MLFSFAIIATAVCLARTHRSIHVFGQWQEGAHVSLIPPSLLVMSGRSMVVIVAKLHPAVWFGRKNGKVGGRLAVEEENVKMRCACEVEESSKLTGDSTLQFCS